MSLLNRIKELCEKNAYTLASLERDAGLGQGTIRRWDKNIPSADKLLSIANLLHTSMDYLLTGVSSECISKDETELICEFRQLDLKGKSAVMQTILNEQKRMNKNNISQDMKETITSVENLPITTKQK